MQQLDVPIIHRIYELYKTLHELQRTIPRSERYSLWMRCEDGTLAVLEDLLSVGYMPTSERADFLTKTGIRLDRIRVLLRLSHDIKILNQKKYIAVQTQLDEIGRMLGGWIKSNHQKT